MSYIGAAANIVGGELQGWASVLEKRAMFDEFKKEQARQQQYRDQGATMLRGFVNQAGPDAAREDLARSKGQREELYGEVGAIPTAPVVAGKSTSSERDQAWAKMRGESRAALGSYSDWRLHQYLNDIQNQESLRQLSSFAGGTAGVFPYRMYKAQHSLDDLAMIGAAISSIGGGAANYAQFNQAPNAQPFTSGAGVMYPQGVDYNPTPAVDPYTGNAIAATAFA